MYTPGQAHCRQDWPGESKSDVQEQDVLALETAPVSALLHALSGIIIPAWGRNSFISSVLVRHLEVLQSAVGIWAFVHHR